MRCYGEALRVNRLIPMLLAAALWWHTDASAGAWTQAKGSGFYKLGSQMTRGTEFSEMSGHSMIIPTLADYTVSLYGEYGLRDDLTVIGYLPFLKRITLNKQVGRPSRFVYFEGDDVTGTGDAQLGVRYRLAQAGATVVSATLTLGLPIGDDTQRNGLLTGDGEANQILALQVGHSLYPVPAYANTDLGYNNRVSGFSDELLYAVEVGYTMGKVTAILRVRGIESRENGDEGVGGGMGGLYANNQSFLTYGPELIYDVSQRMGIAISAANTAREKNALSEPVFAFGVFVKR